MLKKQGLVVAATGDGTNDAPALNVADVGLSMGDGTAVAKEASDMTIQDNSFSTITNAVMWGRSLYKNIQRFIMFQMTINVVACLIVLIGAFIGTESPLTVTQMLWVNLIMDTFAAIALASLPPSRSVMQEKPRKVTDSIISNSMAANIFGVGGLFTVLLFGVLWILQHADIQSMTDLLTFNFNYGVYDGLSAYELSLFFTLFVMLQFWNMFNAKAFMTGKSAFDRMRDSQGFLMIAVVIFLGQILIVELGGQMFNVTPLNVCDWLIIIVLTSVVLWIGELIRLFKK
jgi:Ca2+-transporting ATPase